MTGWHTESIPQKLTRLRREVETIQAQLIEAEAQLADRQAEINAFEFEFEARVGYLLDKLSALDREISHYTDLIETIRNRDRFGGAYLSVERQYQRAWEKPTQSAPIPPPEPLPTATEAEIKKLYRQLARQFHPDLAADETERAYRTEQMAAINDAYAARSLVELQRLGQERAIPQAGKAGQTDAQRLAALEAELARCRRRLGEIEIALKRLEQRPSLALSLQVKLAWKRGEDILAQMAQEFEQQVGRKTVERDMLKAQIDQLGPDQGFIPLNR